MKPRHILPALAAIAVLFPSCQQDLATAPAPDATHQVAARILAGNVSRAVWISTDSVHLLAVTTTNQKLMDTGLSIAGRTGILDLKTVKVRDDQGVTMTAEGFISGIAVWNGTAVLPASTSDTAVALNASACDTVVSGSTAGTATTPTIDSQDVAPWSRSGSATDTFDRPTHYFLSSATPEATILYTLDGSYPDRHSPIYSDTGILVDSTRTIKAIAVKGGWSGSPLLTRKVTLKTRPVLVGKGDGWAPFQVGMSCPSPDAAIRFSMRGAIPTLDSTPFSDSIGFDRYDDSLTFTAIAFDTVHPKVLPSSPVVVRIGLAAPWKPAIAFGTLADSRDGRTYRTVSIGGQTWMAENLDHKVDSSWCNDADQGTRHADDLFCRKFGRLYTWASALALNDTCNAKSCSTQVKTSARRQGVCPANWHVPTTADWRVLFATVDSNAAAARLRADGGWLDSAIGSGDPYGFRLLPSNAGSIDYSSQTVGVGISADFWTSTEFAEPSSTDGSHGISMEINLSPAVFASHPFKKGRSAIRCVRN